MSYKRLLASVFMTLTLVILVVISTVYAQDDTNADSTATQPATIEFEGQITAVNTNSIIVSGLTVMLDDVAPDLTIVIGNTISVSGLLQADGTIQATVIVIINDDDDDDDDNPEATPDVTPEATAEITPEVTEEPAVTPAPDDDDDDDNDDDRPIIVVHGPVVAINVNIVTIYNIDIELNDDDPVLTIIQIGDIIRVEGEYKHDDDDDDDDNDDRPFVIVNVVNITFINVTVIIIDGQIWRDPGDCSGLPEWINDDDAVEYLVRCTGGNSGGGSSNPGGGNNSNNDDDDDDGGRRNNNNRGNRGGDNDDDD